jgi:leucyl-tRNA synthetase
LMFFARWDQGAPWNSSGIDGVIRWLRRVWQMTLEPDENASGVNPNVIRNLRRKLHQTLRSITRDYQTFEFNTIISGLMELQNEMTKAKSQGASSSPAWNEALEIYIKMLAPVAPHISEELWKKLDKPYSIHTQSWPKVDEEAAAEEEITLVVQINGKVRDRINVAVGISEDEARSKALNSAAILKFLDGKPPRQVIYVPGRLVNIVV